MRDVEQQDSETSGLLNKQASADEKPKRRAVALTIVVALTAATALVNLVPASGGAGNLRATRLYPKNGAPWEMNDIHDDDFDLREECQSLGKGPLIGFDLYRDQNLRKASN